MYINIESVLNEKDKSLIGGIMDDFINSDTPHIYAPEEEEGDFGPMNFFSNFKLENVDIIYHFSNNDSNGFIDLCARIQTEERDYYFIFNRKNDTGKCFVINDPNIFLPFIKMMGFGYKNDDERNLDLYILTYLSPNNNLKYNPDIILAWLNDQEKYDRYKQNDIKLDNILQIISKLNKRGFNKVN